VAFLGPAPSAAAHVLHDPAGGILPTFVDIRDGTANGVLEAALADAAPHVVVVMAPEVLPADALAGVRAVTLAIAGPGAEPPRDGAFDRVLRTPGPGDGGGWRARPLPVDDRLYGPVRPARHPPRALCVGRSTAHREWVLTPAKHDHDVIHYTHGLVGDALADVLATADVGIALPARPPNGFPPQGLLHLAAGHLLLATELVPPCGLERGIDYLQIDSRSDLVTMLHQLRVRPEAYQRVRVRGRLKADDHRASRVWPRIVGDLLEDVRAFGTARTLHG
jgi:hypothetical protein